LPKTDPLCPGSGECSDLGLLANKVGPTSEIRGTLGNAAIV